ncbi:MAG: hypothetical protein FWH11_00235 [Micrococcales bacterium]|nr:hypothetical protein [Micrococcales bacterium]
MSSRSRRRPEPAEDVSHGRIRVRLDQLLEDRQMTMTELAERVDITLANMSVPNRRLTPATLGRIWWIRHHHHRVVAAYMGAAEPRLIEQARLGRLQVIGSLIAEGTPSQLYAPDMVADRRHYALWFRRLNDSVISERPGTPLPLDEAAHPCAGTMVDRVIDHR